MHLRYNIQFVIQNTKLSIRMLENRATDTISFQDELAAGVIIDVPAVTLEYQKKRSGSLERLLKNRED